MTLNILTEIAQRVFSHLIVHSTHADDAYREWLYKHPDSPLIDRSGEFLFTNEALSCVDRLIGEGYPAEEIAHKIINEGIRS